MPKRTTCILCLAVALVLGLLAFVFPARVHAQGTLLKLGSRGPEVQNLQQALKDQGFLSGKADGIFGPVTQAAVMAFQKAKGLAADGIAGPKTLAALYGSNNSSEGNSSGGQSGRGTAISRTLRLG